MYLLIYAILGASFMLGRALTSTVWGIIADRHGRKPVMIAGITTVSVIFVIIPQNTHTHTRKMKTKNPT
jgi:MFS family permease